MANEHPELKRKPHRLDSLLRPASIAVLGASERPGTVGSQVIENLKLGGFAGNLYAVNPTRDSVHGLRCFKSLSELPETVEQVIFALADTRVEAALEEVIAHGAKSAVMYSTLVLENDTTPALRDRIGQRVRESGLLVAGANGMGFYNFHDGVWACGFDTRHNHPRGGNVTLISHSGSGMSGILDCEERIDFNLAVSTGQELSVRMDDYMDFAIECLDTRAVGLFMETARNPEGLKAVLEKAARRGIPVVALKVGRTELAARLTVSHSGALAGTDAAYQALFDRYGVQRVEDMDEMATALIMFAQPHRPGQGGLVGLHDSGGERQLLIDLADRTGVELAGLSAETTQELEDLLDPGLPAVNPLDAWSTGGPDYHLVMGKCFATLMADPQAALGAVVHDRAPHGEIYSDYINYLRAGHAASGKPVFLVANRQGTGSDPQVQQVTREGFPILDGLRSFLVGTRCLLGFRDFQARMEKDGLATSNPGFSTTQQRAAKRWAPILAQGETLDEFDSLELLRDFGLPANYSIAADSHHAVLAAATELGYPLALKSAKPGLLHKSDQDGVVLDVRDDQQLLAEYLQMTDRLGPEVLLSRMVPAGVEMVLGVVRDGQFGPLVMLGFGGVYVETLKDVLFALPPFSAVTARRLVDKLQLRPLLNEARGRPAVDIDAYCETAAKLSQLAVALGDAINEVDINPLIVWPQGCVAVDALVSGHASATATSIYEQAS
ncbi:MAG TPA: acetate--CoA ligase family protein [Xanthomonadales bacterium]|nr:acetate--CoA ligase family protein [Xanthomonadales bacterium]